MEDSAKAMRWARPVNHGVWKIAAWNVRVINGKEDSLPRERNGRKSDTFSAIALPLEFDEPDSERDDRSRELRPTPLENYFPEAASSQRRWHPVLQRLQDTGKLLSVLVS